MTHSVRRGTFSQALHFSSLTFSTVFWFGNSQKTQISGILFLSKFQGVNFTNQISILSHDKKSGVSSTFNLKFHYLIMVVAISQWILELGTFTTINVPTKLLIKCCQNWLEEKVEISFRETLDMKDAFVKVRDLKKTTSLHCQQMHTFSLSCCQNKSFAKKWQKVLWF